MELTSGPYVFPSSSNAKLISSMDPANLDEQCCSPFFKYLPADYLNFGPITVNLMARQATVDYGFSTASYGRVLAIRLNGFKSHAKAENSALYNSTGDKTLIDCGVSQPYPIEYGQNYLVLRHVQPTSWSAPPSQYGYNNFLYANPAGTKVDSSTNLYQEPQWVSHAHLLAYTIFTPSGVTNYDFGVTVTNPGYNAYPAFTGASIVALQMMWGDPTFEDPAALSDIVTTASAAPSRLRGALANSAIPVSGSSGSSRLRGFLAGSSTGVAGVSRSSVLRNTSLSSSISVLGTLKLQRIRGVRGDSTIIIGATGVAQYLHQISVSATSGVTIGALATLTRIRGFRAGSTIVVSGTSGSAALYRALASGSIRLLGTANPSKIKGALAAGAISFSANSGSSRNRGVSGASNIIFGASSTIQRLTLVSANATIVFAANAKNKLSSSVPFPAITRIFMGGGEIHPVEIAEAALIGDDTPGVNNRLIAVSSSNLQIDPDYTPTGGVFYTFQGPADSTADPIQLGLQVGDKIQLEQALGELVGLNSNKIFTIQEIVPGAPESILVIEVLEPDTIPYKFRAIKRGI
jgi:hypothetical protein